MIYNERKNERFDYHRLQMHEKMAQKYKNKEQKVEDERKSKIKYFKKIKDENGRGERGLLVQKIEEELNAEECELYYLHNCSLINLTKLLELVKAK